MFWSKSESIHCSSVISRGVARKKCREDFGFWGPLNFYAFLGYPNMKGFMKGSNPDPINTPCMMISV